MFRVLYSRASLKQQNIRRSFHGHFTIVSYTYCILTFRVSVSAVNSEGTGSPAFLQATTIRGLYGVNENYMKCGKISVHDVGNLSLSFLPTFSISEGAQPDTIESLFSSRMTGTSEDAVIFSLVPLTYQQFESLTGQQVTSLLSSVPPPASEGKC